MKEPTMFRVWGTCGEYSDAREWSVCLCRTAAEAQAIADRCNAYAKAGEAVEDYDDRQAYYAKNPDDTCMMSDYTGTHYGIEEIEVR